MVNRDARLCLIGGGGVRTPFVTKTIATQAQTAGIKQLVLFDTDSFRLEKFGKLSVEIARRIDPELEVTLESNLEIAIENCDYIITAVRAGGDAARREDEKIVGKYGLLTQETTGACGFAMAMRSIPVIGEYCELAKRIAKPNHLIFNFTNPAGLVTQALVDQGYPVYGICDSPYELIRQLREMLEVSEVDEFSCNSFGLNHLTWFNQFKINGTDVTERVINHPDLFTKTEMRIFDHDILSVSDNYLLNEYLYFYLYPQKAIRLASQSEQTRGELIEKVNKNMNQELASLDIVSDFDSALKVFFDNYNVRENSYLKNESGVDRVKTYTTPSVSEFIEQDDAGGYAGVAMRLILALTSQESSEMVLSVKNAGAIPWLTDGDVVEVMCDVSTLGIVPRKQNQMPKHVKNLIETIKEYERLAVAAITNGDRDLATKALTINPLVANYDLAKNIVSDFISAYGQYGKEWK